MRVPVEGLTRVDLQTHSRNDLRDFMWRSRDYLKGRVLDYGCGPLKQYAGLVQGEYVGYDPYRDGCLREFSGAFDAVMCNQVVQFVEDPRETITTLRAALKPGGVLVLTFSASWYEVEDDDTWRITEKGMRRLLEDMDIISCECITALKFVNWDLNCVYAIICRNPN